MQLKERLYLIEDRSKAVRTADRSGRHLLGKKGGTITEEEAEFYRVVDGLLKDGASVAEQVVEVPRTKPKAKSKAKSKTVKLKELSKYKPEELIDLTVANLRQLAELNKIEMPAKAKKEELIDLLVAPKEGEE